MCSAAVRAGTRIIGGGIVLLLLCRLIVPGKSMPAPTALVWVSPVDEPVQEDSVAGTSRDTLDQRVLGASNPRGAGLRAVPVACSPVRLRSQVQRVALPPPGGGELLRGRV